MGITNEEREKHIRIANMLIGVITDLERPMLMYQIEKDVAREALENYVKMLEQQPCDNCVSKQKVNKLVDELARAISDERCCMSRGRSTASIMQDLLDLSSITPQRPKGKWIQTKDDCDGVNFYDFSFECSKCGKEQSFKSNYCPNCGADMRESEENADE